MLNLSFPNQALFMFPRGYPWAWRCTHRQRRTASLGGWKTGNAMPSSECTGGCLSREVQGPGLEGRAQGSPRRDLGAPCAPRRGQARGPTGFSVWVIQHTGTHTHTHSHSHTHTLTHTLTHTHAHTHSHSRTLTHTHSHSHTHTLTHTHTHTHTQYSTLQFYTVVQFLLHMKGRESGTVISTPYGGCEE